MLHLLHIPVERLFDFAGVENVGDGFLEADEGGFAFYDIVGCLVEHAINGHLYFVLRGEHDDRHVGVKGLDFVEGGDAVHGCFVNAIEVIIQDDDIGLVREIGQGQFACGVGFDGKVSMFEEFDGQ